MAIRKINSRSISDGTVAAADIIDASVTTAKIQDSAVTLAKLSATGTADSTKFLRGDNSWQVVSVTPTAVSDQANTSTGYFDVPSGTTAQRPVSPTSGAIRFNTSNASLEFFDGTTWISTNLIPYINSLTGTIYAGITTTLSFSLTSYTDTITVRFAKSGTTLKDVTGVTVSGGSTSVAVPSEVYSQTTGDTINVSVINQDGTPSSNAISKVIVGLPTGGTISTSGGYRYHAFTTSGTFSTVGYAGSVNYLIVAGGGGGGGYNGGGGGGAGGYIAGTATVSASTTLSTTIGGGGAGGTNSGSGATSDGGTSGTDTSVSGFLTATAVGGGGGGGAANTPSYQAAKSGGSGGGATGSNTLVVNAGANGTVGQGNAGGSGYHYGGYQISGGGGGGYGAVGSAGSQTTTGKGGDGGVGGQWLNGSYYAGGGGGGTHAIGTSAGAGGNGGGGNGTYLNNSVGSNGSPNTGGGGGGSGNSGYGPYSGGSGIVIVRYAIPS
jgi:hypothetical protein